MKDLNTAQMGVAPGSVARLPRPVDFPAGRGCSRLRVEATVPVKNNTAGVLDFTGARAKAAIAVMFKTSTLKFGTKKPDNVDVALDFDHLRRQCIGLSGDDFIILNSAGVAKRMSDVADADVIQAAVAAGASFNLVLEVARPFEVAILGEDAYAYCPGASQMKQVQWEFLRGSGNFGADANFIQGASADYQFLADDFEAHDDKWASVARLYTQEEAGKVSNGPQGASGLLFMYEYTAAGASTALTLFTLGRKGDVAVHDNVQAKRIVRDVLYTLPPGWYDLNTLVTVLHSLPAGAERNDIPTGQAWRFEQTGSELAPPKTAWCYIPIRSESEWDEAAGDNVKGERATKLVSAAVKSSKGLTGTAASMEPVIVAAPESADFEALPGRMVQIGATPTTHIPGGIATAAKHGAVNSDPAGRGSVAQKATGAISKAIPGWASGVRGQRTVQAAGFASRLQS